MAGLNEEVEQLAANLIELGVNDREAGLAAVINMRQAQNDVQQIPDNQMAINGFQVMHIEPTKFNNDGTLTWDDFEVYLDSQFDGKTVEQQRAILQASLGPAPRQWYRMQDDLWTKPMEGQMEKLRRKFSSKKFGEYGMPTNIIMKINETIDQYELRVAQECVHLKPLKFRVIPNEPRQEEVMRKIRHYGEKLAHEKLEKGVFIGGLPSAYHQKLLSNAELLEKSFSDIVDECKRWEMVERVVRNVGARNLLTANINYYREAELPSARQKYEDSSNSSDYDDAPEAAVKRYRAPTPNRKSQGRLVNISNAEGQLMCKVLRRIEKLEKRMEAALQQCVCGETGTLRRKNEVVDPATEKSNI
jgi:hypothetical protein